MSMLLGCPRWAAGFTVVALLLASPVRAMQAAPDSAPTYEYLIERLDGMPSTLEAQALYDAAAARVQQAGALPNPTLSYDRENFSGSGAYGGSRSAENTVSLSQPLELWGQRRARVDAARSEASAAGLRRDQQRWWTAGQVAKAYAAAEAASRRFLLAEEALALIEQDAQAVAALVKAGREAELRGIQAQSEVESARASLDEARFVRDAAFARLSALAMVDMPIGTLGNSLLDRTPLVRELNTSDPLAVRVAQAELDTAQKLITVERRRALPEVSASLGRRTFQESGEDAMTAGITLTIPLFDRNRGGIRAAYAEQRAAEARLTTQQQIAQADRLAAQSALTASNSRTRAADKGVATAEEAYRLARIGFDAGRISQLELRSSRAALIATRNSAVDARQARVQAEIDLALLEARAPFRTTP